MQNVHKGLCKLLMCNGFFGLEGFKPALNSKGLRREQRATMFDDLLQASPEFKGIKTLIPVCSQD